MDASLALRLQPDPGRWTLPDASPGTPHASSLSDTCSFNDKKWFVLLQMR